MPSAIERRDESPRRMAARFYSPAGEDIEARVGARRRSAGTGAVNFNSDAPVSEAQQRELLLLLRAMIDSLSGVRRAFSELSRCSDLGKLVKTTNASLLENKNNLANRAVLDRCELLREYKAPRKVNQCVLFGLVHSWLETPLRVGRSTGRAILLQKVIWADKSDSRIIAEVRLHLVRPFILRPVLGYWLSADSQLPRTPFIRHWRILPRV